MSLFRRQASPDTPFICRDISPVFLLMRATILGIMFINVLLLHFQLHLLPFIVLFRHVPAEAIPVFGVLIEDFLLIGGDEFLTTDPDVLGYLLALTIEIPDQ